MKRFFHFPFFKFICILVIVQYPSVFAKDLFINKTWIDDSGEHNLVIEKGGG